MSAFGADLALNTAIFDLLVATSAVTDLLADGADGIYTNVEQDSDKPYIVIGDNELTQGALKTCERWVGKVTVQVRTEQADTEQPPVEVAKTILAAVETVLDDTLAVSGYDIIVLSNDFTGNDIDPIDEESVEGRLTYNLDMIQAA